MKFGHYLYLKFICKAVPCTHGLLQNKLHLVHEALHRFPLHICQKDTKPHTLSNLYVL